jgi:hypothetical protein
MSSLSAAKAILEADGTLLATATGGIWDFDETGRLGLSRTLTGAAFDSNEVIKPCVLLKLRTSQPDYILADDANQYVSVKEIIECWFYEDTGYSNIETMRDRVYVLLHTKQLTGTFQVLWAGHFRPAVRDDELDANVERSDYQVQTKKSA